MNIEYGSEGPAVSTDHVSINPFHERTESEEEDSCYKVTRGINQSNDSLSFQDLLTGSESSQDFSKNLELRRIPIFLCFGLTILTCSASSLMFAADAKLLS